MKLYTVWSGEYSDRGMHAIFQSKEKAEKYAEVHEKINGYDGFYVIDYELADDGFDINTEVAKYYYAEINVDDYWSYDHTKLLAKKGVIETDERMKDYREDEATWENEISDEDIDEYALPVSFGIYTKDVIIEPRKLVDGTIQDITVYSTKSYAHARKVAIEQYQIYTQQLLENGQYE